MNFPFEAVEISFSDKLPDRSKQKIGRENQIFGLLSGFSPTA